jgi:hypothetical protein
MGDRPVTAAAVCALVAFAGWGWLWWVSKRSAPDPPWMSYRIAMGIVYGGCVLLLVAGFLFIKATADDCESRGGTAVVVGHRSLCFDREGRLIRP